MFMSDATLATNAESPAGPQDRAVTRSAGLLTLVARLLTYGRDLLTELRQRNTQDAPNAIAHRFGAVSLALIIARITRGLMIATALQARVKRGAWLLDAPARPARAAKADQPTRPRPERPARPTVNEEAELENLPAAREIAERMRHRPIGAVIVEICRDLGIDSSHPLWGDVLKAITCNRGNRVELLTIMTRRITSSITLGIQPPQPGAPLLLAMEWDAPPALATPPP